MLIKEGRRHDARAQELGRAARLANEAQAERTVAEARFTERHDAAERQRRAVGKAAAQVERQRAEERDAGRQRARQIARGREEAAGRADRARRRTADRAERAAAETRVREAAEALGAGLRAVQAEAEVDRLGEATERERGERAERRHDKQGQRQEHRKAL